MVSMDYDYYRNIKSFYLAMSGIAFTTYIYCKYRLRYRQLPKEFKYSNIMLWMCAISGSIHYYMSMYRINSIIGIKAVHYYDVVIITFMVGVGLALIGCRKYPPIMDSEKRRKALKEGEYLYAFLCVVIIAIRIIAEK